MVKVDEEIEKEKAKKGDKKGALLGKRTHKEGEEDAKQNEDADKKPGASEAPGDDGTKR